MGLSQLAHEYLRQHASVKIALLHEALACVARVGAMYQLFCPCSCDQKCVLCMLKKHFWSRDTFVSIYITGVCCTITLMLARSLSCLQEHSHGRKMACTTFLSLQHILQCLLQHIVHQWEWLSCTRAILSKYISRGICFIIIISRTRGIAIVTATAILLLSWMQSLISHENFPSNSLNDRIYSCANCDRPIRQQRSE